MRKKKGKEECGKRKEGRWRGKQDGKGKRWKAKLGDKGKWKGKCNKRNAKMGKKVV